MTEDKEYFISVISSYLNNEKPPAGVNIDSEEIYKLSQIHNVTAIVAQQLTRLEPENRPDKFVFSKFRQQLGRTIIFDADREKTIDFLRKFFSENGIEYMFIKGAVIKDYYPTPQLRTSGDIDVIIRQNALDSCQSAFAEKGFISTDRETHGFSLDINNIHTEFHGEDDFDHEYFKNIFDFAEKDSENRCEYKIKKDYHLLYILCHIIKHFKLFGAGIRMFMDIDVLIRSYENFDYGSFIELCKPLNIEVFARAALSFCAYRFKTPVNTDFKIEENKELLELFEDEMLDGGSFGSEKRGLGDYYLAKGINDGGENQAHAKILAIKHLFFPSVEYLKRMFPFAEKCPILLPAAWFIRIFKGVFFHFKSSRKTLATIARSDGKNADYAKLLNEIGINN